MGREPGLGVFVYFVEIKNKSCFYFRNLFSVLFCVIDIIYPLVIEII